MRIFCWLLLIYCCCRQEVVAQSVLLIHRPLEGDFAVEPLWNYHQDTAAFTGSAEIWGVVHCVACDSTEQPSVELNLQAGNAPAQIVAFKLQPLSLAAAKWHPSLQLALPHLLQSKHWYAFRLTPKPSIKSGYDGVNFGAVFYEAAQSQERALFHYSSLGEADKKHLTVNFGQDKHPWEAVWPKYLHYKGLVEQVDNIEMMQASEKAKCAPYGYAQVKQWAEQAQGIQTELTSTDLELFKAVETLKIITENLPSTLRPSLKRQLHALLRLDIDILEAPTIAERTLLLKRKASLLKELSLYPSLQPILKQYNNATGTAVQEQRQLTAHEQALWRVQEQLKPYQTTYKRIQKLQERLDYLDQQLSTFD